MWQIVAAGGRFSGSLPPLPGGEAAKALEGIDHEGPLLVLQGVEHGQQRG